MSQTRKLFRDIRRHLAAQKRGPAGVEREIPAHRAWREIQERRKAWSKGRE